MFHASIADIIRTAAPVVMSETEEAALIVAAQNGDSDATVALMRQYAPAARNALARFRSTMEQEDAESELAIAFMEMVATHDADASPRLAGRVRKTLLGAMTTAAAEGNAAGWSVPKRMLDRFHAVMRDADGDMRVAEQIAPEHDLSRETFVSIARALRSTDSIERLTEAAMTGASHGADHGSNVTGDGRDGYSSIEDKMLVDVAFAALDGDHERDVVSRAYGFVVTEVEGAVLSPEGHAPLSDGLVGASLGLGRAKTQRVRTAALAKMRVALDVEASA